MTDNMLQQARPIYAGFWRRAGASGVDGLVFTVPSLFFTLSNVGIEDPWVDIAAWTVAGWFYYASLHSSRWQATLGKRAFGIKVTDLQGARITFGKGTWRYLASWVSTLLVCIGYLMAAWTPRKQTLHDKMVGTLVVDAAVAAEDVPRGAGVMPLSPRMKAAIAASLLVLSVISMSIPMLADPYSAEIRKAEAQPRNASPSAAKQEELSYVIYQFPFFGGEPLLVKEGTRTYNHSEIYTLFAEREASLTQKGLKVAEGYVIQAGTHREERIEGFGLTIAKDGRGFSWEWFDRESGDIFRKLQGSGRVNVRFAKVDGKEEIAEILFLDDITMRLDRYWMIPFTKGKTDHLVVKRGSVLWLAD